jgi:hypothetical protein
MERKKTLKQQIQKEVKKKIRKVTGQKNLKIRNIKKIIKK